MVRTQSSLHTVKNNIKYWINVLIGNRFSFIADIAGLI